jgi:hypothetical protein
MSGKAVPLGLAFSIEPGAMVSTCHGIPAGSQLVVKVGADSDSATLNVTDELLDLCRFAVAGFAGPPLKISPDEPKQGDAIFVLGTNANGDLVLNAATVKNMFAAPAGKVIDLSVAVPSTTTGAAVFDVYGRLVGVATSPHNYGAGLNVAMPASWLAQMRTRNAAAK